MAAHAQEDMMSGGTVLWRLYVVIIIILGYLYVIRCLFSLCDIFSGVFSCSSVGEFPSLSWKVFDQIVVNGMYV